MTAEHDAHPMDADESEMAELEVGLEHLPHRERVQMRHLRDWLGRPNWSGDETAEVLAGLDPEMSPSRETHWWLLPGTPERLDELEMHDRFLRLGKVAALRETIRPIEAIRAAYRAGIDMPWLDAARTDEVCCLLLPPEIVGSDTGLGRSPLTVKEVASLGGKAKRDNDPQRKRFYPMVLESMRRGSNGVEINQALFEKFVDDAPPDSTVYGWVKEIKAKLNEDKVD